MFGWHKEDLDLFAINFLHTGEPKQWYSIDLSSNEKFGKLMFTLKSNLQERNSELNISNVHNFCDIKIR